MRPIALLVFLFGASAAAGGLSMVELKVPGRTVTVLPADIDGDGDQDVLVFWRLGVPPESKGELTVFRTAQDRVSPEPFQVIALPPRMSAFDVGDADGDGRDDVLLLQADGVFSLPGSAEGLLRPVQLVKAMTAAAIPPVDHVPLLDLLVDLGPTRGLLVPTVPIGPMALYTRDSAGAYALTGMLRVQSRQDVYTAAEDALMGRDPGALFRLSIPRFVAGDQDADGRRDLIFLAEDTAAVFRMRPDGRFPEQPDLWREFGLETERERIRGNTQVRGDAADFDGDGRLDLLFNKVAGGIASMKSDVWIFRARKDKSYPASPDLHIHRAGFGASLRIQDIDRDGRADLIQPFVEVGVVVMTQVLLTSKLTASFEVHLGQSGFLRERPDFSLASTLKVDLTANQELSGPYPILGEDWDGDGRPDAVVGQAGGGSGDRPDRLEFLRGTRPDRYDGGTLFTLNLPATRHIRVFRPVQSGRPGLLLHFPQVEGREGDVWVVSVRP